MRLKLDSGMKYSLLVIVGAIAGIIIIALAFAVPYILPDKYNVSDTINIMQVYLTAVGMIIIFITLIIALYQFRKSMAKPKIKVAFNENGEQQATLNFKDGKLESGIPNPWIINEGNAISRYFQIDFIIPADICNNSYTTYCQKVTFKPNMEALILSYTNEAKPTLFVKKPFSLESVPNFNFNSAFDANKCIKTQKDSFTIKYRIYGDWAETQEGKLKINIKKEEATHATG